MTAFHPWRRFFARVLDIGFLLIPSLCLFILLFKRNPLAAEKLDGVLAFAFVIAIFMVVEALCLHFFATTPGKYVFGITITEYNGAKPTIGSALFRSVLVYGGGFAFGFSIFAFILPFWHYSQYKKGNELLFDKDFSYNVKPHSTVRTAAYALVLMLLIRLCLPFCYNSCISLPNSGYLTMEEFAENYEYVRKLNYLEEWSLTLKPDGRLYEEKAGFRNLTFYDEKSLSITSVPLFTENNELQGIKYVFSGNSGILCLRDIESTLLAVAFSGCNGRKMDEILSSEFFDSLNKYIGEPVQADFNIGKEIVHMGFRLINASAEESWLGNIYALDDSKPCVAELILFRYNSTEEMETIADFF